MNYLPENLRKEYEYLKANNADIEGIEHPLEILICWALL